MQHSREANVVNESPAANDQIVILGAELASAELFHESFRPVASIGFPIGLEALAAISRETPPSQIW
jgi:hypothetical protein